MVGGHFIPDESEYDWFFEKSKEWQEGFRAYPALGISNNPFAKGGQDHKDWAEGWSDAYERDYNEAKP